MSTSETDPLGELQHLASAWGSMPSIAKEKKLTASLNELAKQIPTLSLADRVTADKAVRTIQAKIKKERPLLEDSIFGKPKPRSTAKLETAISTFRAGIHTHQRAPMTRLNDALSIKQLRADETTREELAVFNKIIGIAPTTARDFFDAVSSGDLARVELCLAEGADPNKLLYDSLMKRSYCPLVRAIDKGNPEVVKALLEAGADINAVDPFTKSTALAMAAETGSAKITQMLLAKRKKITPQNMEATFNRVIHQLEVGPPLQRQTLINWLTSTPSDPPGEPLARGLARAGAVALLAAAGSEEHDNVRLLLENDVPVKPKDEGHSALQQAAAAGDLEMVELLIKSGASADYAGGGKPSALEWASRQGDVSIVEALLDHEGEVDMLIALSSAIQTGNWDVVEVLIRHPRMDAESFENARDKLLQALNSGIVPKEVISALVDRAATLSEGAPEVADHLFVVAFKTENATWLNKLTAPGIRPHRNIDENLLLLAVEKGSLEEIESLVKMGVDPTCAGFDVTALQHAVKRDRVDMVEFLLKSGADKDEQRLGADKYEQRLIGALTIALQSKNLSFAPLLIPYLSPYVLQQCTPAISAQLERAPSPELHAALAKRKELNLPIFRELADACISMAAKHGLADPLKAYIDQGVSVRTVFTLRPLELAAENGRVEVIELLAREDLWPSDTDDRQIALRHALLAANQKKEIGVMKKLVELGAPPGQLFDLASSTRRWGILAELIPHIKPKDLKPLKHKDYREYWSMDAHDRIGMALIRRGGVYSAGEISKDSRLTHLKELIDREKMQPT